jgi:hypothetical protein
MIGSERCFVLKRTEGCESQSFWYSDSDDKAQNESIVSEMDEIRHALELSCGS